MKKIVIAICAVALAAVSLVSCSKKNGASKASGKKAVIKIAMVTDYNDINDQSFNQTTYQACKEYAEAEKLDFKYYKPSEDSTEARVSSINTAIQDGYNVIVLPSYAFAEAIVKTVDDNDDVYFIGLDVSESDLISYAEAMGKSDWKLPANAFCAVYAEEIPGFFAGYAAVKEGFKHLGFLGGMPVSSVIRYGYGFVQGCNKAAEEMGISNKITVEYVYAGQFFADQTITAAMDSWYQLRNVEVVFACGGGIWTSVCEAAAKTGGKVIGVDVDQSALINSYGDGMCVTSAMKGLSATVKTSLKAIQDKSFANVYAGKNINLGLVSDSDLDANFVSLPAATWSMKNFTVDMYKQLVKDIFSGKIKISNETGDMPYHKINVNVYPDIK